MKAKMCWLVVVAMIGSVVLVSCGEKPEKSPPPEPSENRVGAPEAAANTEERLLAAYEKGVDYLRKTQRADGSWGHEKFAVGITGLNVNALALAPTAIREKNKDLIERFCDALWLQEGLSANTLEAYRRDLEGRKLPDFYRSGRAHQARL